MTLLPIIYTSLLIFFSLLALVALISYISYKSRSKENPVIAQERMKNQKINVIKQNIPLPVYSYQISQLKNVHKNFSKTESKQKPLIVHENFFDQRQSYEQIRTNFSEPRENLHRNEYSLHTEKRNLSSTNNGSRSPRTRIEIMNKTLQIQNYNISRLENNERNRPVYDITQTNILNFYQDKEDPRLVAITAVPYGR